MALTKNKPGSPILSISDLSRFSPRFLPTFSPHCPTFLPVPLFFSFLPSCPAFLLLGPVPLFSFFSPSGTGKSHLLTALGYAAAEHGYSVRHTRVVDMINHLTTAQINGLLGKAIKTYVRPSLLLLDELGYLPIDKRGADLLFQVVASLMNPDRSC